MANVFVQRQFNGFLGEGDTTNPVTVGLPSMLWQNVDVTPSTILQLDPGSFSTGTAGVNASLSSVYTIPLPASYVSTSRLSFTMKTDQNIRVSVVSPDHPDSTVLVYVPDDGYGFYSVVETVTSINVVNLGDTDAIIEFACFTCPDLTAVGSWRDGYQTLGVVSS